jgi:CRP-like cAMP-binding protein
MTYQAVESGKIVFRQGDRGQDFYLILVGKVSVQMELTRKVKD